MAMMTKTKKAAPPTPLSRDLRDDSRPRRWRRSRVATAVVLLMSAAAWLSLVLSGAATPEWHRAANRHLRSLRIPPSQSQVYSSPIQKSPPPLPITAGRNRSLAELSRRGRKDLTLGHIVFGIATSSKLWNSRKEFVRLWWRPTMRGYAWMDDEPPPVATGGGGDSDALPPVMVSEDTSRFHYTNPTGHPSGLRISRIIAESFRLGLPDVRWFLLGDDDTIFNVDNVVSVLSKYDSSEMVYVGSPSESHSASTYFSHSMAFGGGGIAISYPLARALSSFQDDCLERYPNLYGSDDRLHACISELGVPLSRELGFHQWDIRGSAHGLLSSHPVAPFVSIHHVEAVDPFYPGLSSLESLKLFTKAMRTDPKTFLQRSICYDHSQHITISVSLGYVVQVWPRIVYPRELERSELTYSAWNGIHQKNEFDLDTKDPIRSLCRKPVHFFLKDLKREAGATLGSYARASGSNDMRRRVFCFPQSPPLHHVQTIEVLSYPVSKNWHLVPRRLSCNLNNASGDVLKITVRQCKKGSLDSLVTNL